MPARNTLVLTAASLLLAASLPALAQSSDAKLGRQKAASCAVCHGPLGISTAPDAPNLAGQPAIYLERQLRAYRSGARAHEVMAVIAKPLTDAEIGALAVWYSSIKVEAQAPD